jgi:diguanylate cyclase (GGDEF)-like protein
MDHQMPITYDVMEQLVSLPELTDPLTGIGNRALFEEHLTRAVARRRRSGAALVVMLISISDLETVNTVHGRFRGDQLLIGVARRLRASTRDGDVLARVGGVTFGVIFEGAPGTMNAQSAAERLLDGFARPFGEPRDQLLALGTIGAAVSDGGAESARELVRNAELALAVAKESDAAYFIYTPAVEVPVLDEG